MLVNFEYVGLDMTPDFEFVGLVDVNNWKPREALEQSVERKNRFRKQEKIESLETNRRLYLFN